MADSQPSSLGGKDLHKSREKRLQEIKRKTEREEKTGILTRHILKSHSKSLTDRKVMSLSSSPNTTGEEDNSIRRVTFGEEDKSKPHKTIFKVGETGTGKSTLINAMVNYMLGVEYKDRIWCEIIETKENQPDSQTEAVTVYDVFVEESPFSLTAIDTPGYGSTEGIEVDFKVTEALNDLFKSEEGVHGIDLVCLVMSAANTRLTQTQRYVFDAVLSRFGKDMERNIVVLITRSPNKPRDALKAIKASKVKCAKSGEDPVYFRFALSHCETMSEEFTDEEEYDEEFRFPWDVTQKNMTNFFAFQEKAETVDVKLTQAVLKNRKQLISCIQNLEDRIKVKEMKKTELEQTKAALEQHEKEKRDNNNFQYEIEESYKVKVPIEYSWWHWTRKATCCSVCEENCHYPGCWWVSSLSWCSVMSEGKCTVCTGNCEYTEHVKENKIYRLETRKVKTYEDLKKKYEKEAGEKQSAVKYLEREIEKQEQEKTRLVEESYRCVVTLQAIALNTDAASTYQYLDFLIEKVKETNNMERVNELQDIKRRAEATCKGLEGFVSRALSSGRPTM